MIASFACMNSAFHKKLRIKGGECIGLINTPKGTDLRLLPLPEKCSVSKSPSSENDVLFWFVKNQAQLDDGLLEVLGMLTEKNIIWIGYPKGKSGVSTDLNRDILHQQIMNQKDISYLGFVSFDDIWSTFCFRRKTTQDEKIQSKPKEREILKFADSKSKTITLPDDLSKAFAKNKAAYAKFEALAFSHRREYIEWIVSAKKPETRLKRIQGTIEKIMTGQKNPTNR